METISVFCIHDGTSCIMDKKIHHMYKNYVLVKMDYFGFYFPTVWFYKFDYLRNLFKENDGFYKETKRVLSNEMVLFDLTEDFTQLCHIRRLEFNDFARHFYHICSHSIPHYVDIQRYEPFLPFLEFLGLDPVILRKLLPASTS